MTARARSAAVWLVAAVVVVALAGLVYLRPGPGQPPAPRAAPAATVQEVLSGATFADANRGEVTVARPPQPLGPASVHYLTSDGGRTWSRDGNIAFAPPMAFDWRDAQGEGARVSADNGRTWRPLAMPETAAASTYPTFLDPRHGWWLARGGGPQAPGFRLWRTDDGGSTWQPLAAAGLPAGATILGFSWIDTLRGALATIASVRPSLYLTDDGGDSWRPSLAPVSPLPGTRAALVWPMRWEGRLLAWLVAFRADQFDAAGSLVPSGPGLDAYTYMLASPDGGRTWGAPIAGPHLLASGLGPPALLGDRLLLLEGRRLWVSEDAGRTWSATVVDAPSGWTPSALIEATGRTLFASATSGPGPMFRPADGLLRSTDGGVHWDRVPLP